MNFFSALVNAEELSSSMISMCITRIVKHIYITAQRLLFATPPRVCLAATVHGPNTSTPVYENGGAKITQSAGRSAMSCSWNPPRSFLHFTH